MYLKPLSPPADADATVIRLWHACPHADAVTDYDRRHIYLLGDLLQAEAEGATLAEMAWAVFGIRADRQPHRAAAIVSTHLARAHWLKENAVPFIDW